MYSSQQSVQILISLLKQYGVSDIIISPGSRNMAIVRSVENDKFFRTHSVVDERSAAYVANGIYLETGRPVAISSTSAQATRNYIPGMTEAYYRGVPLVIITADYRPSMIGQGIMQALDQMSIPKDSAKYSVQLPLIKDAVDSRHCARLVNEALSELDHNGTGPVHIDIPIEEHWTGGVDKLPVAPKITRHTTSDTLPSLDSKKIMVTIGQHTPFTPQLEKAIERFAEKYDAAIYVNPLSNYKGKHGLHANLHLQAMDAAAFSKVKPNIFITIGGQPGDYALDARLRSSGMEHWRVSEDGKMVDTYNSLSNVFEFSELDFFTAYNDKKSTKRTGSYYASWRKAVDKRVTPDSLPLSHAYVASKLVSRIPHDANMHFAILNSFRNWSYFIDKTTFASYSNVAAYGIDGGLSTFIGQTLVSDKLCYMIIGDLSFFYDMNSLGIRHIKNNARVIMVNNSGGGEFRMYSNAASEFGDDANKHIAAAGHNGSAKAWVESMGWHYISVTEKSQLDSDVDLLFKKSDKPVFVEVFTTMSDDSDGAKLTVMANANKTIKGKIAASLSPQAKRRIKKLLKR